MKIKSISFSNFKYIPENKPVTINFENSKALVMGGPNGYGKSTVFDAIELLITGQLSHFQKKLTNRGEITYSVLSHKENVDIFIAGEFQINEEVLRIVRVFRHENNFNSTIYVNNKEIDNDDLYEKLGINKSLFDIGMYISQMNSLDFLQKKYKERKSYLSSILDSSIYDKKLKDLEEVKKAFDNKFNQYDDVYQKKEKELIEEKSKLNNLMSMFKDSQETVSYIKLFKDKNYLFDKEVFDKEEKYEVVIESINQLIKFTNSYEAYIEKKKNKEIDRIIKTKKHIYCALYFKSDIAECKKHDDIFNFKEELSTLKEQYDQGYFYFTENIATKLDLDANIIESVKDLLAEKRSIEKGMNETQDLLTNFLTHRSHLLFERNKLVKDKLIIENLCPLCGRYSEELLQLFMETEQTLKSNLGMIAQQLSSISQKLKDIYQKYILNKVDDFLLTNRNIIKKYNLLLAYLNLSTDSLNTSLQKENIIFRNDVESVDLKIFDNKYELLIEKLQSKKTKESTLMSSEDYDFMERIENEYFLNTQPYTEKVLLDKKQYIGTMFSIEWRKDIFICNDKLKKIRLLHKKKKNRYDETSKNLNVSIKKYKETLKDYEKTIADCIAIPLFVFTGKIIQNFPLGLGITLETEANSITFKSNGLDNDLFNNLSTGQLNGLMLSFLLSVNSVFSKENCLNMLMIDDPLQTIDDISAISLVDLLSGHFQDRQVILSTHEDDKQCLIKRKYEQSGLSCRTLNMQEQYLELNRR